MSSVAVALALIVAAPRVYEDSAAARAGAQSARQRAQSARACQEDARKRVLDLDARAVKEAKELLELYRLKKAAIEELARGYYCSQCGRTGSEIEAAERIPFAQHLQNVQGRAIPAPASRLRAKQQEYDQKIASARARVDDARQRFQAEAARNTRCYQEEAAALNEAAQADAWARTLKGQEELKATLEKQRRLAEAQENEKKAKAEAKRKEAERLKAEAAKKKAALERQKLERQLADKKLRDEKERQLREVEKEAALILARYNAERDKQERAQIAARLQSERERAEADRALNANGVTVTQLGGFSPAPPLPAASGLPPAEKVPLDAVGQRIGDGILSPPSLPLPGAPLFPSPAAGVDAAPPPGLLTKLEALGATLLEPKVTVPSVDDVVRAPGRLKRELRESYTDPAVKYVTDAYQRQRERGRAWWQGQLPEFLRPDANDPNDWRRGLIEMMGWNVVTSRGQPSRDAAYRYGVDQQRFLEQQDWEP